jgi:hypothetical protein
MSMCVYSVFYVVLCVGSGVAVAVKIVMWDLTPCCSVEVLRRSSEISKNFYQTTRQNIREDTALVTT